MSKHQIVAMNTDEALIEGCVRNDRACQQALYSRYGRKMLMVCQRYARTAEDAEDILQEGFVKVFIHIATFKNESKLETWMTRIFINSALNHQRQKLYLFPMVDVSEISLAQADDISLTGFHVEELLTMIRSLPDGCRIVFNLFAIEGYQHKEIASMLGVSEGTSKSQYNRAKMLLRTRLSENLPVYGKLGKTNI